VPVVPPGVIVLQLEPIQHKVFPTRFSLAPQYEEVAPLPALVGIFVPGLVVVAGFVGGLYTYPYPGTFVTVWCVRFVDP
jgi:hypothetical protein